MSDNIPFEIQIEIMKKLPVESLVVSRSVSKAWKSMIDSPVFITDYTNLRQHHRLLIRYDVVDSPYHDYKYVSIMDNDDTLSQHPVRNVPVSLELLKGQVLVGTSQGLLCLFGKSRKDGCYKKKDGCYKNIAVIWNPSLRKSIAIDVPHRKKKIRIAHLGFGVRPDNCDPMIVMINAARWPYPVMVFTLSSRVWRVSHGNLPPESIYSIYSSPVPTDDRCIYWVADERGIKLVVAFDMVSEDFMKINLPHSVAHRSDDEFSISKIRESLALLEFDAKERVYGVWMMVEDCVLKSFTKLFTINIPDALLSTKVLGFRKNDQPIMETTMEEFGSLASLEVYEPRTGTIKSLGINGDRFCSFFLSSYTETLLLLDQLDEQFVKIQLQAWTQLPHASLIEWILGFGLLLCVSTDCRWMGMGGRPYGCMGVILQLFC